MKILRKISVATASSISRKDFKDLTGELSVLRLLGVARSYEVGHGEHGPFLKFKGEFKAIDAQTGEESIAAVAFLPAPVDELLKGQIDALGNDGKSPVEFAFDISAIPDAKTAVGYQYRVRTLTETKVSDPLAALSGAVAAVPFAAPKGAAVAAVTQEPAPEVVEAPKEATKATATVASKGKTK